MGKWILRILHIIVIMALANWYSLHRILPMDALIWLLLVWFLCINIAPSISNRQIRDRKLKQCGNGCELLILFLSSSIPSGIYIILGVMGRLSLDSIKIDPKLWIVNTLLAILVEAIVFWNGILRVYLTSTQLGMKYRVFGILCGWIPIVHMVALGMIIHITAKEVAFENGKLILDESRKNQQICKTKYPILLVHGVFFRDFRYLNYWGRIPKALEQNGATIFYGNQQSAASVAECGKELADRIQMVLKETGADKINIIAHSKGGLDGRYAISMNEMASHVASLTTINTPHRGCKFADYLLNKIGEKEQRAVAAAYNKTLRKLGDKDPDFLEAVHDLTASACEQINEQVKDTQGVFYQSVGSKLNIASGGRFPLNFSYHLVHFFDRDNDGLVGEESFAWGSNYQFLTVKGKRGISHGDMIDLNRENIVGFDVREFYVQLVADLKKRGY